MAYDKRGAYESLASRVRGCDRCPLHSTRTNAVPGDGNLDAKVMLVGEAPGRTEDEQGKPFVGAAGQLLNSIIEASGHRREELYITNVVKCRPPNNRTPTESEVLACEEYLREEIRLVRPRVIVALGNTAGSTLFRLAGRSWHGITSERGKEVRVTIEGVEVTLVSTYHPAAALYKPDLKGMLEDDIRKALRLGEGEGRRRTLMDFIRRDDGR